MQRECREYGMRVTMTPGKLQGTVEAIPSKSYLHRMLIAAALATEPTLVKNHILSEDVDATIDCLRQMGAKIQTTDQGMLVYPIRRKQAHAILNCRESGSTLRFLMPVAAVMTEHASFYGQGNLPNRPIEELAESLLKKGIQFHPADQQVNDILCKLPFVMEGSLQAGDYHITGAVSSQYITGLLLALPLLTEDSTIDIRTEVVSYGYIEMTLDVLQQFGIRVQKMKGGFYIPGGQQYHSPGTIEVEKDWSNASFFLVAEQIGNPITVQGLNINSLQADRGIINAIRQIQKMQERTIQLSQMPDALPALCIMASVTNGITHFDGIARLRQKESDRIRSCYEMIQCLGGNAVLHGDILTVEGNGLVGGYVDSYNDHRIVMACAVAASVCSKDVVIDNAQAVNKSYPGFWEDMKALGAIMKKE